MAARFEKSDWVKQATAEDVSMAYTEAVLMLLNQLKKLKHKKHNCWCGAE